MPRRAKGIEQQRFGVVVADPPWRFEDRLTMSKTKRGADAHYRTMPTDEIVVLGSTLSLLLEPDCALALWCPSSLLCDGMRVMREWGFAIKTTVVWVKTTRPDKLSKVAFGMGRYFRAAHELCLFGTRGTCKPADMGQRSVIVAPRLPHSQKPEHLQDSLNLMYPRARKLELFARRDRPIWVCAGLECPSTEGEDVHATLARLRDEIGG